MARRKSDAEVGPLGVWAYNTRDALDQSVEAVIAALPTTYSTATLRKVEGGSSRPGTRMWKELANLYTRLADEKHIAIDEQPRLRPEPLGATQTPDGLIAALTAQTRAISELVAVLGSESIESRLRVIEAFVLPREQPAGEGSQERSVPRVTTG